MRKEVNTCRQRGFSTLQVVAALAIAGTLTAAAATVLFPMYNRAQTNNAYEELYMITQAIREVREYTGDYALVTDFQQLVDRGYIPSQRYTNGVNENSFGETITAVRSGTGNVNTTVTYTTDSDDTCLNLVDRTATLAGVNSPACGGTGNVVLTVVVD